MRIQKILSLLLALLLLTLSVPALAEEIDAVVPASEAEAAKCTHPTTKTEQVLINPTYSDEGNGSTHTVRGVLVTSTYCTVCAETLSVDYSNGAYSESEAHSFGSGKCRYCGAVQGATTTLPPITMPPVTQAPATQAPATKAPATQAPASTAAPKKVAFTVSGTVQLSMGGAQTLQLSLTPANASSTFTWKSSKPEIASVDQNGRVTALKEGKAKITATAANRKKASVTIQVINPNKAQYIAFGTTSGNMNVSGSLQLKPVLTPSTAITTLTWSSSKTKVATVDQNGLVKALSEGTAKITVKTDNGKKATYTIKVSDPYKPTAVSLSFSGTVTAGKSAQLTPTLTPSTAKTTYTWKSSKTSVATVSSAGLVTGVKAGTAKITVTTANGKKASVSVKVEGTTSVGSLIDIAPYIDKDPDYAGKKLGMKNTDHGTNRGGRDFIQYEKAELWLGFEGNYNDFSFSNTSNPKYCVNGAYITQSASEAQQALAQGGWKYKVTETIERNGKKYSSDVYVKGYIFSSMSEKNLWYGKYEYVLGIAYNSGKVFDIRVRYCY